MTDSPAASVARYIARKPFGAAGAERPRHAPGAKPDQRWAALSFRVLDAPASISLAIVHTEHRVTGVESHAWSALIGSAAPRAGEAGAERRAAQELADAVVEAARVATRDGHAAAGARGDRKGLGPGHGPH